MITPRGWQIDALTKFQVSTNKHFLLDATPGSGKTLFAGFAANQLFERKQIDFALIIVPTTAIKGDAEAGFLGDWNKIGVQITRVLKEGRDKPSEFRGAVITYAQLPNLIGTFETWQRNGLRMFAIFDELHHASEDNTWGSATESLGRLAVKILGTTGTCFRGDQRRIAFVNYDKNNKAICDYSYTYRQAVSERVCRQIVFVTDDSVAQYILDSENHEVRVSQASTPEQIRGATRTVFRADHEFMPRLLEKADSCLDQYRTWDTDAGGIVICQSGRDENDNRHLHYIADLMKRTLGEMPEVISYDDKDANAKIERFRKGNTRWICAVRKISEGVDIKRLRVQVQATRPGTELLFRQLVGRVARVDNPKRPGDATVFIAKFTSTTDWAKKIAEEAEAGLRDDPTPRGTEGRQQGQHQFFSVGASHEGGGVVSDFGDQFNAEEVNAAERLRADDPKLVDVSITTLAYLQRKLGVPIDPATTAEAPLLVRKSQVRRDVIRVSRSLAFARNQTTPDFKRVWNEIGATFGPYTADDMMENYSIEIMRQIVEWLRATTAREASNGR